MPESRTIIFSHKEVVSALMKYQGIDQGIWQLYVEFGIAAANVDFGPDETHPSAVVPLKKIGLLKVEKEGPLAVNANAAESEPSKCEPEK